MTSAYQQARRQERLSAETELALVERWQKHKDLKARDRLILSQQRVAVMVATPVAKRTGLPLDDLLQTATLGLIKAVDRFDPSKGYRLSTYSVWWIRNVLGVEASEMSGPVSVPVNLRNSVARQPAFSLNETIANSDGDKETEWLTLLEDPGPSPEQQAVESDLDTKRKAALAAALSKFDARTADIVARRYGLNGYEEQTLEEVGRHYGITRERVRQLEAKAIEALGRKTALRRTL